MIREWRQPIATIIRFLSLVSSQRSQHVLLAPTIIRFCLPQTFGDFTKAPEPAFFVYTEEVFDLNEDGIDPAIFTVPAGCPQ